MFHEGERAVQARAGVTTRGLGRGIGRGIPEGAADFLRAQRLAVLAGLDDEGRVWASPATGNPGFITAPDPRTLRLAGELPAADPLSGGLSAGRAVGVLVLDPERRRRLRINGHAIGARPGVIEIRTEEVFGNCPKYIQARAPQGDTAGLRGGTARRGAALTREPQRAIERADTLFIASVHAGTGADASHRGGKPGFVRVLDPQRLRIPDYAGNNMFQTLGNIAADPRVGLLFIDFDTGATLQATGRASILWERGDCADLPGAERAVQVDLDAIVEIAGSGRPGWRFLEYSPFNPR